VVIEFEKKSGKAKTTVIGIGQYLREHGLDDKEIMKKLKNKFGTSCSVQKEHDGRKEAWEFGGNLYETFE
jgi:translation initiation factor 1 (eIF-1/SUI1)